MCSTAFIFKKISLTEVPCEISTTMDSVTIFLGKVLFMSSYTTKWVVSAPPPSTYPFYCCLCTQKPEFLSGFIGSGKGSVLLLPGILACCCMPPPKCYAPSSLNTNWKCLAPWKKPDMSSFFRFQLFFFFCLYCQGLLSVWFTSRKDIVVCRADKPGQVSNCSLKQYYCLISTPLPSAWR